MIQRYKPVEKKYEVGGYGPPIFRIELEPDPDGPAILHTDYLAQMSRIINALRFGIRGSQHSECSSDYYYGSEDRGDNRCSLCRLYDELFEQFGWISGQEGP